MESKQSHSLISFFNMPGRSYTLGSNYRFGYQGAFAEYDDETSFNHFDARLYNSRLGRWMTTDPAGQFWSPYMAMGNNWIRSVDPDGRYSGEWIVQDGVKTKTSNLGDDIGLDIFYVVKPGENGGLVAIFSYVEVNVQYSGIGSKYTPKWGAFGNALNNLSLPYGNTWGDYRGNHTCAADRWTDEYVGKPVGNVMLDYNPVATFGEGIYAIAAGETRSGYKFNSWKGRITYGVVGMATSVVGSGVGKNSNTIILETADMIYFTELNRMLQNTTVKSDGK